MIKIKIGTVFSDYLFYIFFFLMLIYLGCATQQVPPPSTPPPVEKSTPQSDQAPMYEEGIIKEQSNLREAPSINSIVLKTLPAGHKVKIIDKTNDWYKVLCFDGTKAYIHESLVKIQSEEEKEPKKILHPVNKPKIKFPDKKTFSIIKDSNMRVGPGTEYDPPLTLIKAGTDFVSDGHTGKWYHGTANNKTGWIHSSLLNLDASFSASPEAPKISGQPGVESDAQKSDESPSLPTTQPEPANQPEPKIVATPHVPEQKTSDISPGKAKISSSTPVKVRAQMSQLSKVVEELSPGAEVTVLENLGSWYKIQTSQNTGFIPAGTLIPGGK